MNPRPLEPTARGPVRTRATTLRPAASHLVAAAVVAGLLVLATAAASVTGQDTGHLRAPSAAGYLLVAVGALALAWASVAPTAVYAVSLVCAVGYQVAAFPGGPGPLPVVAALYFLAARGHRLRSLGLGLLAALTVVGARLLGMGGLESPLIVAFPTAVVAAVFLGQLVAARRSSRAAAARALAEARLQSELEAQGRVVAERLRIARELHDVVAHNISLIHVQATMGVHVMASRPDEAEAALVAIKAASKQALRELRGVLGVLRQVDDDDTRPAPGLTDLDALVSTTSRAGLDVRVHVVGSPVDLTPSVDVTAYRIVQESLTNALRYAPGASTVVTLEYGGRDLTVDVSDDGNPSAGLTPAAGGSGQGITGMRERARALGGTLSATRSPAGGFTVHAQLPLAGGA